MTDQPLSIQQLAGLLDGFRQSAFRLECLPEYVVEEEQAEFRAYLAGEYLPASAAFNDWTALIVRHVAAGKVMQRVRLMPEPLTPYTRYEIEWGYVYSAAAGEDVRLLLPDAPAAVRTQATQDFWLFDDTTLVIMNYAPQGSFLGAALESAIEAVRSAAALRDLLLGHAVPLREYLARMRCL